MKSEAQGVEIDVWAAGSILLCLLLQRYPVFDALSDLAALVEIVELLGEDEAAEGASALHKRVHIDGAGLKRVDSMARAAEADKGRAPGRLKQLLEAATDEQVLRRLVRHCLRFRPKDRCSAPRALEHLDKM
mmetsp:Transcript_24324/g.56552  ORF Transcript_24324/g.56552 Transcript_24324/m.56552 type:complete len:132 (-) Transcript_24324:429-824(-)